MSASTGAGANGPAAASPGTVPGHSPPPRHQRPYRGRFAPSPTGPLHAGSLVAALASRLDALAHGGQWLVRIEDIDGPRSVPGAADAILRTLESFGFTWEGPVVWQSRRGALYEQALSRLTAAGLVYPCACTRREIADSNPGLSADGAPIYPGTCRNGLQPGRAARAWRVRIAGADGTAPVAFTDRWLGPRHHDLARDTGDFILRRADGIWAYQLAVVVDDADQGITDVVRGADLIDSTPRQIWLQRRLGLDTPRYMHVPVLRNGIGEKLSKQTGARALDGRHALAQLREAAVHLELPEIAAESLADFWSLATLAWRKRWVMPGVLAD